MNLREKVQEDIKQALKKGEKQTLSVLRFLQAQIQNREIDKGKKALTDEEVIKLINNQIKKVKESLIMFEKGNRQDLITEAREEIRILTAYLPQQLSGEELTQAVAKIIQKNSSMTQPGPLIGLAIKALSGRADNQRIAQAVKSMLK